MQKTFSYIMKSIRTTPFRGRTLVVLLFFFLFVKQAVLFLVYDKLFQSGQASITLSHYLGYITSDFIVCMVILSLVMVNTLIKKTFYKLIINIMSFGILLIFLLDIFTIYIFQSRISIFDIQQFLTPSSTDFSWTIIIALIILGMLITTTFLIVQSDAFKRKQKLLLVIFFSLFSLGCLGVGIYMPGGFASLPENILSINISAIKEHSLRTKSTENPNNYDDFFTTYLGGNRQKNIIVVFAESLSAIDSLRVGGTHDNLPYFDKIQQQGITFTNFFANGCTSDTAHIGFLLGIEPLKLIGSHITYYSGYRSPTEPLPQFFSNLGYNSIFVSSAGLGFLNQRSFLSGAGFTRIIGEEYFSGEQKYVFDAAPDYLLYRKTLETIQQQTGVYFLALQTISFHKPYDTPYGKTQEEAIRYTDKSLYYFYLKLRQQGFFENGILVIVGDHRKMEPLEEGEKEALGDARHAKSLATIVGTNIKPGVINTNLIQHIDFFYSLKRFAGKSRIQLSNIFNKGLERLKCFK